MANYLWQHSCGAISRASLEKDEAPTISYESFVQDLDHGDSFTTTLVDILVKVSRSMYTYFQLPLMAVRRNLRTAKHARHRLTVT